MQTGPDGKLLVDAEIVTARPKGTTMASTSKPRPKKTEQLGFKVDQALYLEVEDAAQDEHRKRNEFARLIFEWGFAEFKKAGSFDALIGEKNHQETAFDIGVRPDTLITFSAGPGPATARFCSVCENSLPEVITDDDVKTTSRQ